MRYLGTCEQVIAWLSDYLDEDLDGESGIEVERHLRGCGTCQAFANSLRRRVKEGSARGQFPCAPRVPLAHQQGHCRICFQVYPMSGPAYHGRNAAKLRLQARCGPGVPILKYDLRYSKEATGISMVAVPMKSMGSDSASSSMERMSPSRPLMSVISSSSSGLYRSGPGRRPRAGRGAGQTDQSPGRCAAGRTRSRCIG